MTFQWNGDVGRSSINEIKALATSSGVQFSVTSTYRPNDPGYHGTSNAVDMATSSANMAKLAAYLYQYSPYLLELIHSGGGGYFVKDGIRGHQYPADIVSQHYNHVHCASTLSALQAATSGKLTIPAGTTDKTGKGCLSSPATVTALMGAATFLGSIIWIVH